jgi:predicted DCC family thiol-disulfide oxidoreductase YuxK
MRKMAGRSTLIYDGDCRFCARWVERWRITTGERVRYLTAQEAAAEFPEVAENPSFDAVQWIGAEGDRWSGAPAVFAALATSSAMGRTLLSLYQRTPWFARTADTAYRLVARHRMFFSQFTRLLWGADVRPPTFAVSTWIFLRLLGLIYLMAFLSYGMQLSGLNGNHGILPASEFFRMARQVLGSEAFLRLPSVCWLGASEAALQAWCGVGIIASLVLLAGFLPLLCLVVLWTIYLSLTVAGQTFYQFQWDILLLEAGFLAIFLSPVGLRLDGPANPPRAAHFLVVWLLFRLIFSSGVVKLTSGDPTWAHGTALDYHYFTQPLPTPLAWYAQQLPSWWQGLSVWSMFFIELGLPFLLFGPRNLRLLAAAGIAALQLAIALTGNYGFFNLLTLPLCLACVDDAVWRGLTSRRWSFDSSLPGRTRFLSRKFVLLVAVVVFLLSLVPLAAVFRRRVPLLEPLMAAYEVVAPLRTINGYGLFAVMTTERKEIVVQGSEDGVVWKTYTFRFKPGDPHRAPPWVAPYMPRLDWQMWFAALGTAEQNPWFLRLLQRLLEGSPSVTGLLAENPFPARPPAYVRALSDQYTFTTPTERKQTGNWWKVEPAAIYCPAVSLEAR